MLFQLCWVETWPIGKGPLWGAFQIQSHNLWKMDTRGGQSEKLLRLWWFFTLDLGQWFLNEWNVVDKKATDIYIYMSTISSDINIQGLTITHPVHDMNNVCKVEHTTGETSSTLFKE